MNLEWSLRSSIILMAALGCLLFVSPPRSSSEEPNLALGQ